MPGTEATSTFYRREARKSDRGEVRRIVESTGFFHDFEVDVAVELVDERLAKGEKSGYEFAFAERDGRVVGYSCWGPIACTVGSIDLYWVAVEASAQGAGLGRSLMELAESEAARAGGRRVYVETSSREQYRPTRTFYERCGYRVDAVMEEFYGPGDGKVVYVKVVGR